MRAQVLNLDSANRVVTLGRLPVPGASDISEQGSEETDFALRAYDACVLALGSEPYFGGVVGAAENAHPFYTLEDALSLRSKLLSAIREGKSKKPLRLTIVGGSYVGVELAANLASWLDASSVEICLIHRSDALVSSSANFARMVAKRRLSEKGVDIRLNTKVVSIDSEGLELSGGSRLSSDLVVWAAGTRPSAVASKLGLPLDEAGRIPTNMDLSVVDADNQNPPSLFALGDVAFPRASKTASLSASVPRTAQTAMQQAEYAAWNVRASLCGDDLYPFRYLALGEMLSLGEDEATLSALGGAVELDGALASASRRAVYAARMPTGRQALKVGLSWGLDALFGLARKK